MAEEKTDEVEEQVDEVVKESLEKIAKPEKEEAEEVEKEVEAGEEEEPEEEDSEEGEAEAGEEASADKEAPKEEEAAKEEGKPEEKKAGGKVIKPGEAPTAVISSAAPVREDRPDMPLWNPKTQLGREVFEGKITSIDQILESGRKIMEPEIVDALMPDLKSELILVGGRKGKGGGKQRIPVKITAAMHRSGRRFTANSFAAVGNENGIVGIGKASAVESRDAIQKAIKKSKLNLIKIKRGCGSWECQCGENHSIPFKTKGKSGSVKVELLPAPKGLGLVADDQSKRLLRLAGIKDIWIKTYGNTSMRMNLITAVFNALKNLYIYDRGS